MDGNRAENNTGGYINTWRGTWRDTYDGRREGLIHMERPRYLQQFGGKITSGQAPVLGRLITKYLHLFVRVPISGSSTRSALWFELTRRYSATFAAPVWASFRTYLQPSSQFQSPVCYVQYTTDLMNSSQLEGSSNFWSSFSVSDPTSCLS